MDELWNVFLQSGSVEDYLNYRNNQDANDSQGSDNKRTDGGGE